MFTKGRTTNQFNRVAFVQEQGKVVTMRSYDTLDAKDPYAFEVTLPLFDIDRWCQMINMNGAIGRTIIIGFAMENILAKTDFWSEVENQLIKLDVPSQQCREPDGIGSHAQAGVQLVLSPPTCIVPVLTTDRGRRAILADIGNWGFRHDLASNGQPMTIAQLVKLWQSWIEATGNLKNVGLRLTAGSQSLALFRKHFGGEALNDTPAGFERNLERDALMGGRVNCFWIGRIRKTIHEYDISSCYPALAATIPLPVAIDESNVQFDNSNGPHDLWLSRCVADVIVKTTQPVLPVRTDTGIDFPCGTFRTVLCGPELCQAYRMGCLQEVIHATSYVMDYPLASIMRKLIHLRQNAKQNGRQEVSDCYKALANSLLGRLAARYTKWVNVPHAKVPRPWMKWIGERPVPGDQVSKDCTINRRGSTDSPENNREYTYWRSVGGLVQYQDGVHESSNTWPLLTAWICSAARMELWHYLSELLPQHVVYCDTDSLMVTDAGRTILGQNGHLDVVGPGHLRHLRTEPWIEIYGLRNYATPTRIVRAGKPREEIVINDGTRDWCDPEPIGVACSNGRAPISAPPLTEHEIYTQFRGGHVLPNGMVEPHLVLMEEKTHDK